MKADKKHDCDYVIVMTACIDPGGRHPELHRSDPEIRKQDYETALHFWVTHPDPRLRRVLFIENTGYPLQEIEETAAKANAYGKDLEFISLQCNDCPPGVSYGYPELTMIDLSLSQSRLISQSRYLIKVTGRLRFPDLPRLLDRLPEDFLFAVDSRNYRLPGGPPMAFTTTQLMIFSIRFYADHLIGLRENLTPDLPFIEQLFYRKLMTFRGQPGAILRWPVNVDPHGMAAHAAKDYRSSKQRVTSTARAAGRVLLPSWWI